MKTTISFMMIGLLINGDVLAHHLKDHTNHKYLEKLEAKSTFKISERKILKKRDNKAAEDVSNFSMEELRTGAQHILTEAEIQYFKSQCRYAFMSDKEVIENRCEVKKVTIAK